MFQENEFKAELVRKGYTVNSLVETMRNEGTTMNVATMYRKINGTSDFFLNEIQSIARILNLDGQSILRIFFA